MHILKETGIYWCERRLINKLFVDQSVKVWLDQEETRIAKNGKGVKQERSLSPILLNEAVKGCGGF
jgi:hypothetical protein